MVTLLSIARFASSSAREFSDLTIWTNSTALKRFARSLASRCRGTKPGALTLYFSWSWRTTSNESPSTSNFWKKRNHAKTVRSTSPGWDGNICKAHCGYGVYCSHLNTQLIRSFEALNQCLVLRCVICCFPQKERAIPYFVLRQRFSAWDSLSYNIFLAQWK